MSADLRGPKCSKLQPHKLFGVLRTLCTDLDCVLQANAARQAKVGPAVGHCGKTGQLGC
jgi:hypothetical protein